mgnify:FL=1
MGLCLPLLTLQLECCGEKRRGQAAQSSGAFFHNVAVCGKVNARGRQGHDGLGAAFAVHSAPAAKAVVRALHGGKGLQSLIHSSLNGIGITPKTALFRFGSERTLHGEAAAEEIGVRPNLIECR